MKFIFISCFILTCPTFPIHFNFTLPVPDCLHLLTVFDLHAGVKSQLLQFLCTHPIVEEVASDLCVSCVVCIYSTVYLPVALIKCVCSAGKNRARSFFFFGKWNEQMLKQRLNVSSLLQIHTRCLLNTSAPSASLLFCPSFAPNGCFNDAGCLLCWRGRAREMEAKRKEIKREKGRNVVCCWESERKFNRVFSHQLFLKYVPAFFLGGWGLIFLMRPAETCCWMQKVSGWMVYIRLCVDWEQVYLTRADQRCNIEASCHWT